MLNLGDRVVVKNGDVGRNDNMASWIAGPICSGSTGTICSAVEKYPELFDLKLEEHSKLTCKDYCFPFCIVWDHNPNRQNDRYYWGIYDVSKVVDKI